MIISKNINVHTIFGLHMVGSIYMIISILILGNYLMLERNHVVIVLIVVIVFKNPNNLLQKIWEAKVFGMFNQREI